MTDQTYQISTNIPAEIFRAYDIRGIVDESFTPNNIYTIALGIGSVAIERGEKEIIIGRDGRLSGPELLASLAAGLMASGLNVINIGEVTTPILYYATNVLRTRSGVMLSGSHNPPNYNGLKSIVAGETLYGDTIQKLYQRICAKNFKLGQGKMTEVAIIDEYIARIVKDVALLKKLKIVIDCGSGVGGKVAPKLFRDLGCEVVELYCEVDGRFPHHHPDPSNPKNLVDLIAVVKKEQADAGLAFDGDADRIVVITDKGESIAPDRLVMFLALDVLTRFPGATIVFDVKSTRHLAEQIALHGGKPVMSCTGHSLIKAKMKETGAILAGEFSGHTFIKERWYGFDDGIYTGTRFLELLSKSKKSCSEIFAALPNSIATPELNIAISESEKFKFIEQLQKNAKFTDGKVLTIDGVRVDFADGFGLVRASNTTPYLVLRFEGDTPAAIQRIQNVFREQLLALNPKLNLPF